MFIWEAEEEEEEEVLDFFIDFGDFGIFLPAKLDCVHIKIKKVKSQV